MRVRLLAMLGAACLLMLGAVPASAHEGEGGGDGSYLALGDSVPFGFNPLVNPKDASNFVGYPEVVAESLELHDVNATCPGEATGGFLSLTGTDNVCRPYRFVFDNPLHVEYHGAQMDFVLRYLRGHPHTRLVTLTLGAGRQRPRGLGSRGLADDRDDAGRWVLLHGRTADPARAGA